MERRSSLKQLRSGSSPSTSHSGRGGGGGAKRGRSQERPGRGRTLAHVRKPTGSSTPVREEKQITGVYCKRHITFIVSYQQTKGLLHGYEWGLRFGGLELRFG